MANYDYGHDRPGGVPVWWSGIAGYIKYAPNDKWAFATRGEWFNDHDGFETGTAQHLSEFTFTLQRMLAGKLMSRLEFRRDMSNQNTFPYRDFEDGIDHQNTVDARIGLRFQQRRREVNNLRAAVEDSQPPLFCASK